MKQSKFPPGWDEQRVRSVLGHYESQSEEEAVAEDEASREGTTGTVMEVPTELVPKVRELIAKHKKAQRRLTPRSSGRVEDKVPSPNSSVRAAQLNRQATDALSYSHGYRYDQMIPAALSFLLSGLATLALLSAFAALVPRVAGNGKSLVSVTLQWVLIVSIIAPAIAIATFGPLWLYEVTFSRPTTKDLRFWFLLGGAVLLVACLVAAVRSAVGRRYFSWQSRVA